MSPEHWQQVERIYHDVAARAPGERDAFLRQACAGDEALRCEVERLLEVNSAAGDFLEAPAIQLESRALAASCRRMSSGTRIGPYEVTGPLGAGGMGEVYKARDTRLNRTVAIKVLPEYAAEDQDRRKRLLREARAASALNHPNIVTIHDVLSGEGQDCIVMECVEGRSLANILRSGPVRAAQAVEYAIQIADALSAAHDAGIVHRDIKPGNIMVTPAGAVKVLDFGLAKLPLAIGTDGETASISRQGTIAGTVAYMSPEQAEGKTVDARSDIFSFGIVLYEMLSGRQPFSGESDLRVLHAVLHDAAPPLSEKIPAPLRAVIAKAMEKEPANRYQSAADMAIDLRRWKRDAESRAGIGPRPANRRWRIIAPCVATGLALLAAGYSRLPGKPKLTDKDTIVLADFTNTTGDPVFDGTLRQGLSVQLEQSPFLSIVSEQRIQHFLALTAQPRDARLTADLAQQVCVRAGSAAVLEGSIAPLGSQYVLGLRARNCRTGDILDEEQAQFARKEDVLAALSQIASKFRTRVGESLAMVQQHDIPLAEATTPSLDALKAFSTAISVLYSGESSGAIPIFKRAVELDPNFAVAHAYLGRAYGDIGETELSAANLSKAWQLRDRTSDVEKFFITANYHLQVTGNMEKAEETFEVWERAYPREIDPPGLLSGQAYPFFGKFEEAAGQARRLMALDPSVAFSYINLATALQFVGRLSEAEAAFEKADDRKLDFSQFLVQRYDLGFLRGDESEMDRAVAAVRGKPQAEGPVSFHQGLTLAYSGHLRQAKQMARRAVDLTREGSGPDAAAMFMAGGNLWDAFFGNAAAAEQGAREALKLSKARDVEYGAGLALALSGDSSGAEGPVDDLTTRFPEDSSVRIFYEPVLRAAQALNHGEPSRGIDALEATAPYDLGIPLSWFNGSFGALYPVYVRGLAYLAAHQGAEAAAEFQKIIDHRSIVANDPIGALARLQLGRALHLAGDDQEARAAYQDFLTLWKDADPDIPILTQAKAEFARLQR